MQDLTLKTDILKLDLALTQDSMRQAEWRFLDALNLKQYERMVDRFDEFTSQFEASHSFIGLPWELFPIEKVTKSSSKQKLFYKYVQLYKQYLPLYNRSKLKVIRGQGLGNGQCKGKLELIKGAA